MAVVILHSSHNCYSVLKCQLQFLVSHIFFSSGFVLPSRTAPCLACRNPDLSMCAHSAGGVSAVRPAVPSAPVPDGAGRGARHHPAYHRSQERPGALLRPAQPAPLLGRRQDAGKEISVFTMLIRVEQPVLLLGRQNTCLFWAVLTRPLNSYERL